MKYTGKITIHVTNKRNLNLAVATTGRSMNIKYVTMNATKYHK